VPGSDGPQGVVGAQGAVGPLIGPDGPQGVQGAAGPPGYVALQSAGAYSPTISVASLIVTNLQATGIWRQDVDMVQVNVLVTAISATAGAARLVMSITLPLTRASPFADGTQAPGITQAETPRSPAVVLTAGRVQADVGSADTVTALASLVDLTPGDPVRLQISFYYLLD
jgi:hypothetical protein